LPFDVLQDDVVAAVGLSHLGHGADVRVVEGRDRPRFLQQSVAPLQRFATP
jgi:hypothetical protein